MIEADNRAGLSFDLQKLENIANSLTDGDIELIITDNQEIQQINKEFRGIDKSTDVLSFPYEKMPHSPLGSIVISKEYVEQKALEFSHTPEDELTLLFIHGLLHVMGYDHETDDGEMREMEKKIIEKFHLPKSLIVRTQG